MICNAIHGYILILNFFHFIRKIYNSIGRNLILKYCPRIIFYNTYKKNTFIWGSVSYGDLLFLELFSHWKKTSVWFFYIDFVRGTPFQKAKIIQKLSVTVYYQKRLSDLDTLIKITITKIISFQHQKYSFNIKLLKLIWFKLIWNRHGHECSRIWKLSGNCTQCSA